MDRDRELKKQNEWIEKNGLVMLEYCSEPRGDIPIIRKKKAKVQKSTRPKKVEYKDKLKKKYYVSLPQILGEKIDTITRKHRIRISELLREIIVQWAIEKKLISEDEIYEVKSTICTIPSNPNG